MANQGDPLAGQAPFPRQASPFSLSRKLTGQGMGEFAPSYAGGLSQFSSTPGLQEKMRQSILGTIAPGVSQLGKGEGMGNVDQAPRIGEDLGSSIRAEAALTRQKLRFRPLMRSEPENIPGTAQMAPDTMSAGVKGLDQVQTVRNRAFFSTGAD